MKKPLIAIIGSIDARRQYELPIRNPGDAEKAMESLGAALAKNGYRIIVYSAEPGMVEGHAVRGFIQSGKAAPRSIVALFPLGDSTAAAFPERTKHEQVFDIQQDNSTNWEVSFYRSLAQADGVVLMGGGRSTLISGVLALTYRVPLLALAAYGGDAEKVWCSLVSSRDLPTEEEIHQMAMPGSPEVVGKWIGSLQRQFQAKEDERRKRSRLFPVAVALALVCLWVATLPIGYLLSLTKNNAANPVGDIRLIVFTFLLFFAPLLSGASGATIRTLLPDTGTVTLRTTVLGVAAGAVASLLYVLGQLIGNSSPYNFVILVFSVAFGFIAGLTFDGVFKKLETMEALQTDVLTQKKP
jgi:hypothetical protein